LAGGPTNATNVARKPVADTSSFLAVLPGEVQDATDNAKDTPGVTSAILYSRQLGEIPTNNHSKSEASHKSTAQSSRYFTYPEVWWRELIACSLVASALTALIVTLAIFDGQTLPMMPYDLSANTPIAIPSAILYMIAGLVLAGCFSQASRP
jgi:hypothetical protein